MSDTDTADTRQVVLTRALTGIGPANALVDVDPAIADNLVDAGFALWPPADDAGEPLADAGAVAVVAEATNADDDAAPAGDRSLPSHSATKAEWADAGRAYGLDLDPEDVTKDELVAAVEKAAAGR